jgi:hypothetical protein
MTLTNMTVRAGIDDTVSRRWFWAFAALLPQLVGDLLSSQSSAANAFDVLRPCVAVDRRDIARLDAGGTLARILPEEDGNIAVFGARRVAADGDCLVAWMRQIDRLKQSRFVESMARFSDPPVLDDLARLSLDAHDLQTLRDCTSGTCLAKLTAREVEMLRQEVDAAGETWAPRLDDAFRRIVLDRVQSYTTGGHRALGQYVDGRSPVPLDAVFGSLLKRTPCLTARFADLAEYVEGAPEAPDSAFESFLYWSKERLGAKPIVSATHVIVGREHGFRASDALIVGKQIFATHYMNGSLNITAVVGSGPGSPHYLVILNRTNVDFLRGILGGLARMTVERRIKAELPSILDQLARMLESGRP